MADEKAIALETSTTTQVLDQLVGHLVYDETEKFTQLLKQVSDLSNSNPNSKTKSGLFGINKNKNNNDTTTLNLKNVLTQNIVNSNSKCERRLLSYAIENGDIIAVKTLIDVYKDDIKPPSNNFNTPLATAVHYKEKIVGKRGKQAYFELLTFLLSKGCTIRFDKEEDRVLRKLLAYEDIIMSLLYQYKDKDETGDEKSNINIDDELINLFVDAHSNKAYKFSYDWKKWNKLYCKICHCIRSGNLHLFKCLLKLENAFGMKKLNWNENSPVEDAKILIKREYKYVKAETLFEYMVLYMRADNWKSETAIEFWDHLMNDIYNVKNNSKNLKRIEKDIFNVRTNSSQTVGHLVLENASQCPKLVDRIMELGLNPNDEEYQCYVIRYVAPSAEAMKIVMNENGKYKYTFDLVCFVLAVPFFFFSFLFLFLFFFFVFGLGDDILLFSAPNEKTTMEITDSSFQKIRLTSAIGFHPKKQHFFLDLSCFSFFFFFFLFSFFFFLFSFRFCVWAG